MSISRRSAIRSIAAVPILFVTTRLAADKNNQNPDGKAEGSPAEAKWQSLFDGKELGHWKPTDFGGQGESKVEDGNLVLTHGESLTGVTWQGPLPAKMNYEIELDAQRVDGTDFFCGLTFPVNNDSASLILGGWGGGVCGISNIDDNDAARNDTTSVHEFKKGKWYHVRVRITPDHIEAWLDKEQIVDADTKGKKISVRAEVEASQPLGIATYQTTGAIKNIRLRKLDEAGKK
jgi:hypothetical protein